MKDSQPPYHTDGSTPPFLGLLLAALYRNGLDHARITKESIEDDVHQLVEIKQFREFDSTDWIYRWSIRGEFMPVRDVHRDMAAAMLNKPANEVTPEERAQAKNTLHAHNYRADPYKVALDMVCREGTWTHRTILGAETFVVAKQWKVRLLMAGIFLWMGVELGQLIAALIR